MNSARAHSDIASHLQELSSELDVSKESIAIILAAGHGKRIRSKKSKMLHEIWGKSTVERVSEAATQGLKCQNQIIVVGIKAKEVADALNKDRHRVFSYQEQQNGTGDAVRTALNVIPNGEFSGHVYIFPGDIGLLDAKVVEMFKEGFERNESDMMVLTGIYEGDPNENYYGRILRVPKKDASGTSSGEDYGKVIEIKEHKDIKALRPHESYEVDYRGKKYSFTKDELLKTREFNTGVFAFRSDMLQEHISNLRTDNVQKELYVTDLISIFNQNGLSVKAFSAPETQTVLGFNTKSVLKEMQDYAREKVYAALKDKITIEDRHDFFIAEEMVDWILENSKDSRRLDIVIGKGAHIGKQVELNKDIQIQREAHLEGRTRIGAGVKLGERVRLLANEGETIKIGANTQVGPGNHLLGNVELGENCRIESGVTIEGSASFPTTIGDNVVIKGVTRIEGCKIDPDVEVEHSVLRGKHIKRIVNEQGQVQAVRYYLPNPEGLELIGNIPN